MSVDELEALLDQTYLSNPLPHSNRALAIWYCLLASEDAQRNLFGRSADQLSSASLIFYLDRFKYSMRYALARIAKETHDLCWPTLPRKIVGKLHIPASRLMLAGLDYSLAAQLCGALRTGTAVCRKEPDAWRVNIDETHHDKAYGALELMGIPKRSSITAGLYLYYWIRQPRQAPEVLEAIAASTVVQAELVNYRYRQGLAVALSQAMRQEPPLIPQDWVFPWSDLKGTRLLLNALLIRCTYHMVAVHFGALGHGLRGGGVSSLVLVLTVNELVDDLELLSSVPRSHIQKFVHALSWGRATTNPDPALQPFIPLGNGNLAVPCIHVMTSDQERNLLSLQARIDSASFNSQSWRFERDMVASLAAQRLVDSVQLLTNVRLQVEQTEEEIDAVLVDKVARQLLMCELRWMLPPGDPREVQNRKSEALKKVDQLARKVELIIRDPSTAAAQLLGPDNGASEGDWTVTGVVLIAGYGGTRSPSERFPIIPVTLFERALSRAGSLAELSAWCLGLKWLPVEGKHFKLMSMTLELSGSIPLKVEGLDSTEFSLNYPDDALASLPTPRPSEAGAP